MTVGTGVNIWQPGVLSVTGTGAPPAAQIISAQLTYGALGTCQGGTLKLARLPAVAARSAVWQVNMAGQPGAVFAGLVDQVSQQPGELADVPLLAPHRVTLDALGAAVGSPYALSTFGVAAPVVAATETMATAITRALDPLPTADYGVGPELAAAIGTPDSATFQTYDVSDSRTLSVRSLGYSFPDYVTDAIFDPGDGWQKSLYFRNPPATVLRRSATATADPAIVSATVPLAVTFSKNSSGMANIDEARTYEAFYGTPPEGASVTGGTLVGTGYAPWRFAFVMPVPSDVLKYSNLTVTGALNIGSVTPQRKSFNWAVNGNPVQTTEDSQDSGTVVTMRLLAPPENGLPLVNLSEQELRPFPGNFGTFTVNFNVPGWRDDLAGRTLWLEVAVSQTKGHKVVATLKNAVVSITRSTPNVGAVVMPPGWTAPYVTGPIFEVKLKGWHIPPFKITGLPGGLEQMAAGATVTFSRNEVTTTITTVAWPYEGQRRGG